MRHINLFFILLAGTFFSLNSAQAQTGQGNMHIGGGSNMDFSLGSSSSKVKHDDGTDQSDGPSTTSFNFNPKAGYFIMDGLAVGADIRLGASSTKGEDPDYKNTSFRWSFGPYARYYTDFNLFGEFGVGFGTQSSSRFVDGDETSASENDEADPMVRWNVGAGYALFVGGKDQVAIEPMISYRHTRISQKPTSDNVDANLQTSGDISLSLGISVFL
jgi:hypothetical protein